MRPEKDLLIKEPPGAPVARDGQQRLETEIIPALCQQFGDAVQVMEKTPDGISQLAVGPKALHDVAAWLKDQGCNLLLDVAGVDYLSRQPRFEVVYHLLGYPELLRLRLRVMVEEVRPEVPTVSDLWPSANPAEREVWDMFGIKFRGHPNLKRILNPEDWEGHPLRKDYPLRGPRELYGDTLPAERNRFFPIRLLDEEDGK